MNLIIDIGNTVAKIAVFKDKDIVEVFYDSNQTLENLPDICAKYAVEKAIAATVIDLNEQVSAQLARLPVPLLWLNETTSLPVENLYETPETLGYDRMAAVGGGCVFVWVLCFLPRSGGFFVSGRQRFLKTQPNCKKSYNFLIKKGGFPLTALL